MNTTFKVVFNQARGVLMVANEVTSCVQSKGTKSVLASAFALALIGMSGATFATLADSEIVGDSVRGYSVVWDGEEAPSRTIKVTFNKALKDDIQKQGPSQSRVESYGLMIKDGAAGALENATIVSTTYFPRDRTDQGMNVALGIKGGDVTLKGATTHISATSSLEGSDPANRVSALLVEGGVLNLRADKTEIRATSSNKTGQVAYGIEASAGRLIGSGNFNVTAISQGQSAYALYGQKDGFISLSGNTTVTAIANAKNANAYAVYLQDSAKLLLGGQQNVLTGEVSVQNTSVFSIDGNTVIKGDLTGDGTINNNGTIEISGALEGFTGTFNMTNGNLSLTKENGYFGGRVFVGGGTLNVLNTDVTDFHGTQIYSGATLLTSGKLAFGVAADDADLSSLDFQYKNVEFVGANLAINDEKYSLEWAKKATERASSGTSHTGTPTLLLTGTLLGSSGVDTNRVTSGTLIEHTIMSQVHYDATTDAVTPDGIQMLQGTIGVQSVSLNKDAAKVYIRDSSSLTLVGSPSGGELISAGDKSVEVNLGLLSHLTLGNAYLSNTTGSISNTVNVTDKGQLDVAGGSFNIKHVALSGGAGLSVEGKLHVEKLSGQMDMTYRIRVGNSKSVAAHMSVDSFEVDGTQVFLDPIWEEGIVQTLDKMSKVAIKSFKDNTVKSDFLVNAGGLLSLGDVTTAAAESLLTKSGVTLGKGEGKTGAALYVDASNGPLTLNNGILVGGLSYSALSGNTLTVTDGAILLIDAAKVKSSVFGDAITVAFEAGADAFVDNITKDGLWLTGKGGSITLADGVTIRTNDHMLILSTVSDGKLGVTIVDNKKDAQITDQGVFDVIHAVYEAGRNNTNATHQADAFASRVAQGEKYFGSMDAANQVASEMRSLATMAGVQSTSWDSASLFNDRVQTRQSLANLGAKGTGLWADLYASRNKSEGFGGGAGYEADIHGGIFGADTTLQNGLTVGAALTYAKADTDTTGTLAKISNKSEFVGVSVYGAMPIDRANVMADVTYLYGDHDVKANAGGTWGDRVTTNLFAVGVRAEWLSTYAGVNVMPHVGMRFTTLETDGYEAAFDTAKTRQNIVTLPVGVTLSADLTAGDWAIKPIADFSVIPAIGDRNVEVAFGAQQKLAVNVIDSGLFNATLGLAAHKGAWTIGVNYRLSVGGNKRSNNTFNANMSYAF